MFDQIFGGFWGGGVCVWGGGKGRETEQRAYFDHGAWRVEYFVVRTPPSHPHPRMPYGRDGARQIFVAPPGRGNGNGRKGGGVRSF